VAQVGSYYDELQALNTNVVAISFGLEYWARAWLAETQSPFPVWLDPTRQSYHAFGLESSIIHSWGWNSMRYYLQAAFRGQRPHFNRGNTNQLGGDFIVDAQGIVRLAHPSHDPTDRASLPKLLAVLRQLG